MSNDEGGFEAPPITGYNDQTQEALDAVNSSKAWEVQLANFTKYLKTRRDLDVDPRWMSIAITHFEEGFMALNRSIFKPANPFRD